MLEFIICIAFMSPSIIGLFIITCSLLNKEYEFIKEGVLLIIWPLTLVVLIINFIKKLN